MKKVKNPQIVSQIVAIDRNYGIGKNGDLPWRLSSDLKRFKKITTGKPILMGRKTHLSIGRALSDRRNIVLSRQKNLVFNRVELATSLDEALGMTIKAPEIMIIGGASVYQEALPFTDRIYLTIVDTVADADTFFPELEAENWRSRDHFWIPGDKKNAFGSWFMILEFSDSEKRKALSKTQSVDRLLRYHFNSSHASTM